MICAKPALTFLRIVGGGTAIFRSDSNGEVDKSTNMFALMSQTVHVDVKFCSPLAPEDLEGFAGAGLYDSVTVKDCHWH